MRLVHILNRHVHVRVLGEKHLHCDVVEYITKRSGCDPKSSCLDDVQNHRAIIWHHSEKKPNIKQPKK